MGSTQAAFALVPPMSANEFPDCKPPPISAAPAARAGPEDGRQIEPSRLCRLTLDLSLPDGAPRMLGCTRRGRRPGRHRSLLLWWRCRPCCRQNALRSAEVNAAEDSSICGRRLSHPFPSYQVQAPSWATSRC